MKKEELAQVVDDYGDAIITYRSENSKKLKYNVCTLNFRTPYIQQKRIGQLNPMIHFYYFVGIRTLIVL